MVGFPLLLIPLAVYNIIAFLMPGVALADTLFQVPMPSGAEWPVTLSDILLALGVVLLLLEIVKGSRPGAKYFMDHLLSLIVFGAAAAEFVLLPKFSNSTFFLLTLLSMADFLGGVAQRARRRVVAVDAVPTARRKLEEPVAAPVQEPVPQPVAVSPATAAPRPPPPPVSEQPTVESVLLEHAEPERPPASDAGHASSEVPSPDLQQPSSPDAPSR